MSHSRMIVLGSINMDVVVTAPRHPQLGETVFGDDLHFMPGGKGANQAIAARRLGGAVKLIGRLGRDEFGATLQTFLSMPDLKQSTNKPYQKDIWILYHKRTISREFAWTTMRYSRFYHIKA